MSVSHPGDVVRSYWFEPHCLLCGGELHHVHSGQAGQCTQAVAECRACERTYVVGVAIKDVTPGRPLDVKPGTWKRQRQRARKAAAVTAGAVA